MRYLPTIVGQVDVTPMRSTGPWWRRWSTRKQWRLTSDLVVVVFGIRFKIDKGTVADFASVPRFLVPLLPPDAVFSAASLLHDHLYQTGKTSKWFADAIFFDVLRRGENITWLTAGVMWLAVWLFGWPAWAEHRRRDTKRAET
mgnify:CR=1 FL=1